MKKTVIVCAFAILSVICKAQEVIKLNETKIEFTPFSQKLNNHSNSLEVVIKESKRGEFEKDPVAFMNAYFDINNLISNVEEDIFDSYEVTFKSRKGLLKAEFNNKGNLLSTSYKFKNVLVPSQLGQQIYKEYKGWAMIQNFHISSDFPGKGKSDYFIIKMKRKNEVKKLKINTSEIGRSTLVAVN